MSAEHSSEESKSEEKAHVHSDCICCETSDTLRRIFRGLRPSDDVSGHFRQSRIELLKGIRSLLDERIERLGHTPHKGTRVVVE